MNIHLSNAAPEAKSSMKPMTPTGSGDVVAWLEPVDGPLPPLPVSPPPQKYRLVQKNKLFIPHLLVVPTGSSIDFPNEDPFFHNVFSLFNGKRFDLGLYEAGSHRPVRFDREGVSYIFCNIHPEMGAIVISLNTPYSAVSSKDGSLSISGVSPGEYTLTFWAEGVSAHDLAAAARKITITRDNLSLGTIGLTRTSGLAQHKNKFGEEYKPTSDNPY